MRYLFPIGATLFLGFCSWPQSLLWNFILGLTGAIFLVIWFVKQVPSSVLSFIVGFTVSALQFHWTSSVIQSFSDQSILLCWAFSIVLYSFAALPFVFTALMMKVVSNRGIVAKGLCFCCIWTLLEIYFPRLIPWYLSSPLFYCPPFRSLSRIGGPEFTSLCLVIWIVLLLGWLERKNNRLLIAFSLALPALAIVYHLEITRKVQEELAESKSIVITAVQPNLDVAKDFTQEKLRARTELLRKLSIQALKKYPESELLVWPESAFGYTFYSGETQVVPRSRRDPLPGSTVPLLFGAQVLDNGFQGKGSAAPEALYFNSAILLEDKGQFAATYQKQILFPFSETTSELPGSSLLNKFFAPVNSYKSGTGSNIITLKTDSDQIKAGLGICFEDIWSGHWRAAGTTSELLIVLSNDGWFARTRAGYQHRLLAYWRAVERSRSMLRISNEGPGELISPLGGIAELSRGEIATEYSVQVQLVDEPTTYSRFGRAPVHMLLILVGIAAFISGGWKNENH